MTTQKMNRVLTYCWLILKFLFHMGSGARYTPDWKSLDTRPVPAWFGGAKFGISVHWGVYSVPSFGLTNSEEFRINWQLKKRSYEVNFMKNNYKPGFTYVDFAPLFTAELFDPDQCADIFSRSGARYVILTAKHLDGYTLWPSNFSLNWNSMDVGPHRDLVGDLSAAVRRKGGMRFGVEHSKMETFHPLYIADKASRYQPDIIWSQGDGAAPSTYWNSTSFLAWLYSESPVCSEVVVNDRWGYDVHRKHGDFLNYDPNCDEKLLMRMKWLRPVNMDKYSWGYRREAKFYDYLTAAEIIKELVTTVSRNGNLLLDLSATKDGIIPPVVQERLSQVGTWLGVNGEAVYDSTPWKYQKDAANPNVWYTAKHNIVYAFMLKWPKNRLLYLESLKVSSKGKVTMLGWPEERLQLSTDLITGTMISLPTLTPDELPTQWAWVLKVEGAL